MAGAALVASVGCQRALWEVAPERPDGLGALAKRKGIVYGANIPPATFRRSEFVALAEKELAGLTPMHILDFGIQRPTRDQPLNFDFVDALAAFAKARGWSFVVDRSSGGTARLRGSRNSTKRKQSGNTSDSFAR
jgi:hypothetical protein